MSSAEPAARDRCASPARGSARRSVEQPDALLRLLDDRDRVRPRRRGDARARGDDDPHGGSRLVGQRGLVRRVRVRHPPRLDGAAGLDLAQRLLRRRARHVRLHRARALAVGSDAGRRRVRAPGEEPRRLHRRDHQRPGRPSSPSVADAVLDLRAGPELAVAATKTYSNQLAALGLLAAHAAGEAEAFAAELARGRGDDAAAHPLRRVAHRQRGAAVRLCGPHVRRRPRSRVRDRARDRAEAPRDVPDRCGAAHRHGSRARAGRGHRLALSRVGDRVGRRDAAARSSKPSSARARRAQRSSRAGARPRRSPARTTCSRAHHASTLLAPFLSIVPGQLFAGALARARGLDPDAPRGLSKVTLAR